MGRRWRGYCITRSILQRKSDEAVARQSRRRGEADAPGKQGRSEQRVYRVGSGAGCTLVQWVIEHAFPAVDLQFPSLLLCSISG